MSGLVLKAVDYDPILNSVSHVFEQGKFHLITGASGAGKSTLLRLIGHFAELSYQGEISWQGRNLAMLTHTERAQQVGMVFQNVSKQFVMTTLYKELIFVLENIGCPPDAIAGRIALAVAQGRTEALLHRPLRQLSGGEKQRAALTVVLALNPAVLLLDEPFASVDRTSRLEFIALLAQLRDSGKTILLVDHELSGYAAYVDAWHEVAEHQIHQRPLDELVEPPVPLLHRKVQSNRLNPVLRLKEVNLAQGSRCLLKQATFTLNAGLTVLTGDNGVGKSTLLKAIMQQQAYQGKMYLNDNRLRTTRQMVEQLTLVVQEAEKQFVTTDVQSELAYGQNQTEAHRQRQQAALTALELEELIERPLYQLSQGQKKMIQLICLLTSGVKHLLLDEPFASLDERASHYFAKWLRELADEGSLILVVTHRLEPLVGLVDCHLEWQEQQLQVVAPQSERGEQDDTR